MSTFDVELIAEVCHEANRVLQRRNGDPESVSWAALDDETKASAIDGVRKAMLGSTPEDMHMSWARFKLNHGWQHGPVRDVEAKTHPLLIPWDALRPEQQAKDVLFLAIVDALTNL